MNKFLTAALTAGAALVTVAAIPAQAREGCGRGYHRGWHNRCMPNRGYDRGYDRGAVVAAPGVRLVIGNYYPNQGYWDGSRYWQHRYRNGNGWRYR
ncbi:GCG_CRPN prefix-to-repeats domain-containing protein [Sphingomonas sp.]|jgi:hypothetical protein|uniref:GCG_CRPN prefix-to-repeats domain-containing protein n=1 Tax=Sphingomonas sp. TaxID=28214 RepID=UPI002E3377F4|nr:hypothetical protein [Sphingomonas sp.]HEX4693165.1 hypothetical protein [Sphingomonas sp.]